MTITLTRSGADKVRGANCVFGALSRTRTELAQGYTAGKLQSIAPVTNQIRAYCYSSVYTRWRAVRRAERHTRTPQKPQHLPVSRLHVAARRPRSALHGDTGRGSARVDRLLKRGRRPYRGGANRREGLPRCLRKSGRRGDWRPPGKPHSTLDPARTPDASAPEAVQPRVVCLDVSQPLELEALDGQRRRLPQCEGRRTVACGQRAARRLGGGVTARLLCDR